MRVDLGEEVQHLSRLPSVVFGRRDAGLLRCRPVICQRFHRVACLKRSVSQAIILTGRQFVLGPRKMPPGHLPEVRHRYLSCATAAKPD